MWLGLVLVLAGCRLGVAAELDVGGDGAGSVTVLVDLDPALLEELDALGVDPTAELEAAVDAGAGDWTLERRAADDALTLVLRRPVDAPDGFGDALRSLSAGLTADDPGLVVDVEVAVEPDGSARVEGTAGFRPPATAGATLDGEPIGPSGEELATIVAAAVEPRLVVTLPGSPVSHDADRVDGRTLSWDLPVGEPRTVGAVASPPTIWSQPWPWAALGGVVLVVGGTGGAWWWRRRR